MSPNKSCHGACIYHVEPVFVWACVTGVPEFAIPLSQRSLSRRSLLQWARASGQGFKGKRFRGSFSRKAVFWSPPPSSRRKWSMAYGRQRVWIRHAFLVLMHFRYSGGPQQMYQKHVSSLYECREQISSTVQIFSCISYLTSFVCLSLVLQGQDILT